MLKGHAQEMHCTSLDLVLWPADSFAVTETVRFSLTEADETEKLKSELRVTAMVEELSCALRGGEVGRSPQFPEEGTIPTHPLFITSGKGAMAAMRAERCLRSCTQGPCVGTEQVALGAPFCLYGVSL
jgi:hypothetical protein